MSLLGLNDPDVGNVQDAMFSSGDSLPGYDVEKSFGIVEGVSEHSFPAIGACGIGVYAGGDLSRLLEEAKDRIAAKAFSRGANAIIGFRYVIMGREVEKSVLAYGTAVKCKRCAA